MKTLPRMRMLISGLPFLPFARAPAWARHSSQAYGPGTTQSSPKCFQIGPVTFGVSRSMFGDQVCSFSWPEAPCFPPKYPLRANFYPDFWECKTLLGRTHCQREATPNQNSNSIPTETSPKLAALIPESEVIRTGGGTAGQCSSRYKVLWGLQREQRELGNKRAELWDHTETTATARVSLHWGDSTAQGSVTDCARAEMSYSCLKVFTQIFLQLLWYSCVWFLSNWWAGSMSFLPLSYEVIKIRKQISPPNE